jgi:lyso-ornithine lipid O-acyltransferase
VSSLGSVIRSMLRTVQLVGYFARYGTELLVKRPATRQERADWLHRFCSHAMKGLNVPVTVTGEFPANGVVISNHLGYLDIIVFAALKPCVFVSKAEIANWPVLGWMTTMAGTVYVNRGHGGSAVKARGGMTAAADAGLPVVFFPEGTTSNGSSLLTFHSGLLAQAMMERQPVTAAYVQYTLGEGNDEDVTVADDVCYWGDASMWAHIFRFLGLRGVRAEVRFAEGPIAFSSDVLHRKQAAREAQAAVQTLRDAVLSAELEKSEAAVVEIR